MLLHPQSRSLRQVTLAPEPVFHGGPQSLHRHARSDLHLAVTYGNGVVKNLVVGEIAHAEAVEPFHWAGQSLPTILVFHPYLAREHNSIVTREWLFALPRLQSGMRRTQ